MSLTNPHTIYTQAHQICWAWLGLGPFLLYIHKTVHYFPALWQMCMSPVWPVLSTIQRKCHLDTESCNAVWKVTRIVFRFSQTFASLFGVKSDMVKPLGTWVVETHNASFPDVDLQYWQTYFLGEDMSLNTRIFFWDSSICSNGFIQPFLHGLDSNLPFY